jgi:beta-lactamase regulating signal transducer with metallopeptidase domain
MGSVLSVLLVLLFLLIIVMTCLNLCYRICFKNKLESLKPEEIDIELEKQFAHEFYKAGKEPSIKFSGICNKGINGCPEGYIH